MYRRNKVVLLTTALLAIIGTTANPAASHQATNTASSDVVVVTVTNYFEPPADPLTPSYPAINPSSSYVPAIFKYHKTASHSANAASSSSSSGAFVTKHSKKPTTPATPSHPPKTANTTSLPAIIKYHKTASHQSNASPAVVIEHVAAPGPPAPFPRAYRPIDETSPHRTVCQVTRKVAHRSYDITGWAWHPNKTKDEQEHWNWNPIKQQEIWDKFRPIDFDFRFHLFSVDEQGYQKFTVQMNVLFKTKHRDMDYMLNDMLGLKTRKNHSDRSVWCTKKPRVDHEPKLDNTPWEEKWDWEVEGGEKGKGHESDRKVAFEA